MNPHERSRSLFATASLALLAGCASEPSRSEVRAIDASTSLETIEIRANTFTYNTQNDPGVAIDSKGRVFSVWASRRQEFKSYGIFAQLLDPLGRPLTHELHVNEYVPNNQREPYAVFGPDDTAWVVWSSFEPETEKNGIFLRRFADGPNGFAPVAGEQAVQVAPFEALQDPAIAVNADGEALVVFVRTSSGARSVEAVRLDANGEAQGEPIVVASDESMLHSIPDLVALPSGDFFAVWSRTDTVGQPLGLAGRLISEEPGDVVAISEEDGGHHVEPSIAVDDKGRMVVAWMTSVAEAKHHVRARRFAADGTPLAPSFRVDEKAGGFLSGATAACAPDGRFLVAFNDLTAKIPQEGSRPTYQVDIRARKFDAQGKAQGSEFQVNLPGQGRHILWAGENGRRAAWSDHDQIAFAWWGMIEGDPKGAAVTLLAPSNLEAPAPEPFERLAVLDNYTHDEMTDARAKPEPLPDRLRNMTRIPSRMGAAGGFVAHPATGWEPPDPDLAVGPNHIVTQVNQEIAWFTKDGTLQHRQDNAGAGGFWAGLGAEDFVFDPINVWDRHSQRFIVANSELASDGDYLVIAVSKTDDPNDGWWKYRHEVTPDCAFPDFPNLGVDEDAIYITTDCFSGGGNNVFVYDKSIVTNGLPLAAPTRVNTAPSPISLGNTNNYDTGSPAHYMVTAFSGSNTELTLFALTDPVGSPSLTSTSLTVPFFDFPLDAPQMGSSNLLSTIDIRIKAGVVRNGRLYAAHGIDPGIGETRVRWYEIDLKGWPTSGMSPSLVQSGTLDFGSGVYSWFPDIGVDDKGNIAMAYSRSASNEMASIGWAVHEAGSPAGSIQRTGTLQTSTQAYGGGRWGDYSGIDEDPTRPGTFWSHHEYSEGSWSSWVGQWTAPPASVVVRNGTGVNPLALGALSLPILGTGFQVAVDPSSNPTAAFNVVQAWSGPMNGPVLALGEVLVNISSPALATDVQVVSGGAATIHTLPLPNDPFLAGLEVSLQAGIVGGGVQLTNALDTVLNY